ncbi:bifunctional DNA primase/polymerase [Parafrankia sp. FMc6]|uniref:bifunctional DNA primase/polymerase n=1 Tax=Parafrankia soli TaxID=2599596 RepID=UPI0034D6E0CF
MIFIGTDRSRNVSRNGRAALALARRGIHTFPVPPGTKRSYVAWGTEATTDPAVLAGWWARWPAASVGVACRPSGLIVVDIDGPTGMESWSRLVAKHSATETATVTTSRADGGAHLWFLAGDRQAVPNSTSLIAPGVDIRGNRNKIGDGAGGMVIAPPSIHRSGRRYQWASAGPLAPLPGWLRSLAMPPAPARRPSRALPPVPPDRLLVGLVKVVLDAPEGTRNSRLFWAGTRAAEHAAAGRLDTTAAVDALLRAAESVGLPALEAARTVQSALYRSDVA